MKVWEWLKKWWKWIAVAVGLVCSFIIGLILRPKPQPIPPQPQGKTDAEKEAQAEKDRTQKDAAAKEQEIKDNANKARDQNVADVKERSSDTGGDLNKVNDLLHKVGEDIRQP